MSQISIVTNGLKPKKITSNFPLCCHTFVNVSNVDVMFVNEKSNFHIGFRVFKTITDRKRIAPASTNYIRKYV